MEKGQMEREVGERRGGGAKSLIDLNKYFVIAFHIEFAIPVI